MDGSAQSGLWWVKVGETAYGPYRRTRMLVFILEGRIRAHTKVRSSAEAAWRPAWLVPEFLAALPVPKRPSWLKSSKPAQP